MHFLFFSLRIKNDIHNKHKIQDKINNVRTQALLEYNATAATLISNFLEIWLKNAKSALKPLNKMSRYKFIYLKIVPCMNIILVNWNTPRCYSYIKKDSLNEFTHNIEQRNRQKSDQNDVLTSRGWKSLRREGTSLVCAYVQREGIYVLKGIISMYII